MPGIASLFQQEESIIYHCCYLAPIAQAGSVSFKHKDQVCDHKMLDLESSA